jgi:hypothetical protein
MFIQILAQFLPLIYNLAFVVCISIGLISYILSIWKKTQKNIQHLKRLHQIPCSRCVFFTGNHNLKCTVHPYKAFHEEAIGCADYQMAKS